MSENWLAAFLIASCSFLIFISIVFILKAHQKKESFSTMMRMHFLFLLLFIGFCCYAYKISIFTSVYDIILSCFVLGSLHCVYFMNFFYMTLHGFSLNILMVISENKAMSFEEITQAYGEGRGVDYVVKMRVHSMFKSGLLAKNNSDEIFITKKGKIALAIRNYLENHFQWKRTNL